MSRTLPPRHRLLALAVALCLGGGCDRDSEPPAPAPPAPPAAAPAPQVSKVARLEELSGEVQLQRGGKRQPAARGELLLGDSIETGADGRAMVRFAGGRTVELGPDAKMILNEDKTGLVIEVPRGLVLSRVPADAPRAAGSAPAAREPTLALTILTPFGLTRVGSGGGEVAVDVKGESARVAVKLGEVEFVSRNGESTKAGAGDALDVSVGKVELAAKAPDIVLEPIQVTLVVSGGKAELKKRGSQRWRPVGRDGAPLEAGDEVRAREGEPRLSLADSGTTVALERGTELSFEKSERKGDVEESRFEVRKGGLTLDLSPKRRSRLVLGDLALESSGGGHFDVSRTRDGLLEVSAVTGDVTVQRGELAKTVRAGQVARVGKQGAPEVEELDRAQLSLPARGNLKLFHSGAGEVALTWEGEPGDYRVEVSGDSGFARPLLTGLVHKPQVMVSLPRRGSLYWRAFTPDGKTEVGRGSIHAEPEPEAKDLARLRNEVPESGEKTTIFYQDKPPAVTLTWRGEPRAARYRVAVYKVESLARPVAERSSTQPMLPLEAGILSEGHYAWSVTPLSASGEELRGGKMNKLDLVYDNSVTNLVITAPRNGEVVEGGKVRAAGVAPVGSRLAINGKPVGLDDKSRFDTTVAAGGRAPVVVFRLSRPSSQDAYTIRMLKRSK